MHDSHCQIVMHCVGIQDSGWQNTGKNSFGVIPVVLMVKGEVEPLQLNVPTWHLAPRMASMKKRNWEASAVTG